MSIINLVKGVCNMQVSSINPSFKGYQDSVDAIISLDDNSIKKMAYMEASMNGKHERNRKITNALFYSAPIAAGLGSAILKDEFTSPKIFSKEMTGLGARAAKGLKVGAAWTAGLAALDLMRVGLNKLEDKSYSIRKFNDEHPILEMFGKLAAGFGVLMLAGKGFNKLGQIKAPEFMQRFAGRADKFLNNNKYIQSAKNGLLKLGEKTPPALKEIGAVSLDWSPAILLAGGLLHSISSRADENREVSKIYNNLKQEQADLTKRRLMQLSVENDLLMQDAQNRETVELLNNPTAGLPEEVTDKIAELD